MLCFISVNKHSGVISQWVSLKWSSKGKPLDINCLESKKIKHHFFFVVGKTFFKTKQNKNPTTWFLLWPHHLHPVLRQCLEGVCILPRFWPLTFEGTSVFLLSLSYFLSMALWLLLHFQFLTMGSEGLSLADDCFEGSRQFIENKTTGVGDDNTF